MIDARDARRFVDAGVFSLGIPIGGPETGRDAVDQSRPQRCGVVMAGEGRIGASGMRAAALENVLGMMAK